VSRRRKSRRHRNRVAESTRYWKSRVHRHGRTGRGSKSARARRRKNPSRRHRGRSQDHTSRIRSIRKGLRAYRHMKRHKTGRRAKKWATAHKRWSHRVDVKQNPRRGKRSRRGKVIINAIAIRDKEVRRRSRHGGTWYGSGRARRHASRSMNPIYKRGRKSRRWSMFGYEDAYIGRKLKVGGGRYLAELTRARQKERRHGRIDGFSARARTHKLIGKILSKLTRRNPSRRRNAPVDHHDKAQLRRIVADRSIPLTRQQKNAIGRVLCMHQGRLNPGPRRRRNPGDASYRGWSYDTIYDPSGNGQVEVHVFKPSGALHGRYIAVDPHEVRQYTSKIIDEQIADPGLEKAYARDWARKNRGYNDNY
jgi:hypothetical protein